MLDDIILFTELVEYKNFSKAAQSLNISQSTLSKRIANLENSIKLTLIVHHTRQFTITADGEVLYQKFKHLRRYLKENIDVLKNKNTLFKKTLKVCISTSFAYDLICPHISEFLEQNPDLSLQIFFQHEKNDTLLDYFDIAITNFPIKKDGYECFPISNEIGVLFCTPRYKEQYGIPKNINELENHRFIGIMSNNPLGVPKTITFKHRYRNHEFIFDNIRCQLKVNLPAHMKQIGLNGDYIFGSWQSICQTEINNGKLIHVLEDYETYPTNFYLTTEINHGLSEKKFIDFISECLNKNL